MATSPGHGTDRDDADRDDAARLGRALSDLAAEADGHQPGAFLTVEVTPVGPAGAGSATWDLRITGMVPRAVRGGSGTGTPVAPGAALNLLQVRGGLSPADDTSFHDDGAPRSCRAGTGLTPVFATERFTRAMPPGDYLLAYTATACPPVPAVTGRLRLTVR